MKPKTFNLKIANPCAENWDDMTVTSTGRLCSSCAKVVVDFSGMSTQGIADYFKNAKGKVCGQFTEDQLKEKFIPTYKNPFAFNSTFLRLSLAGILTFSGIKGFSQSNNKAVSTIKDNAGKKKKTPVKKAAADAEKGFITIEVKLSEVKTGKLITHGNSRFEGGSTSFYADKNGIIKVLIPDSLKEKTIEIYFYAPGFTAVRVSQDLRNPISNPYLIEMKKKEPVMVKGDVGIEYDDAQLNKKCTK